MNRVSTLMIVIAAVSFLLWPSEAQLQEKLGQHRLPQTEQTCNDPDRTFNKPTVESYRLDWCLYWGKQCGEDAAHAWCQYMHYARAIRWAEASDIGAEYPTWVLYDQVPCNESFCDGFEYIVCTCQ